jgi:hypothetical protein
VRGVPTTAELVEAVEEFLRREVVGETIGRLSFDARVAANVLGIVSRELEMGARAAAGHAGRLEALGVGDDRGLVAAIRAGAFDDRTGELVEALRASTTERLAIANPRYLEADDAL